MLGHHTVSGDVVREIAQLAVGLEFVHRHAHVLHVGQGLHLVSLVDLVDNGTIRHGREQRDNGDNDQKFDQGETPV